MSSRVNSFIEMFEMFEMFELFDDFRNCFDNLSKYLKTFRKFIENFSKHSKHFEKFEITLSSRSKNIFYRLILKIVDVNKIRSTNVICRKILTQKLDVSILQ